MATLRRRAPDAAPSADDDDADDEPDDTIDRPWHASTMVRVILALLTIFVVMHLFLWKVVYDFAMDTNHERLRGSVRSAMSALYDVLEHL